MDLNGRKIRVERILIWKTGLDNTGWCSVGVKLAALVLEVDGYCLVGIMLLRGEAGKSERGIFRRVAKPRGGINRILSLEFQGITRMYQADAILEESMMWTFPKK
ncbi:hypothetical protein Tco_0677592 [Tanacetum coccineum]|uniref:Uncharacterized protein n=1 Tax=Tanacetum coccineum TaxID=301880 RepID=A0ABQ4XCN0_9ASTR